MIRNHDGRSRWSPRMENQMRCLRVPWSTQPRGHEQANSIIPNAISSSPLITSLRSLHSQLNPKRQESPAASPAYVQSEGLSHILPRPRRHLIYLVPDVGTKAKAHGFADWGRLTLEFSGSIHLGPDIESIDPSGEGEFRAPSTFGPHISHRRKHRYLWCLRV